MKNNINQIIRSRRSIYPHEFNGNELEIGVVETILENANYAPNHKSNYPWRFIVVCRPKTEDFYNLAAEIYRNSVSSEDYKDLKMNKILACKSSVSHVIAIVMHREPEDKTVLIEDICAVAASVQNMYLTLSQYEHAGGYWSTGLGTNSEYMRQFLNIAENEVHMGFFIIGATQNKRTESNKKPYTNFVKFI